jgi:hypothetical protein
VTQRKKRNLFNSLLFIPFHPYISHDACKTFHTFVYFSFYLHSLFLCVLFSLVSIDLFLFFFFSLLKGVGKEVRALKKHSDPEVSAMADALVTLWKDTVKQENEGA